MAPGAGAPVLVCSGADAPGGQRHQQVLGKRRDEGLVHPAHLGELVIGASARVDDHARGREPGAELASSDAGSRSGDESMGGRPSTCGRSTTAGRAIANVNLAWRAQASWMPTITSALASRIVVSAVSHDWLSCCER